MTSRPYTWPISVTQAMHPHIIQYSNAALVCALNALVCISWTEKRQGSWWRPRYREGGRTSPLVFWKALFPPPLLSNVGHLHSTRHKTRLRIPGAHINKSFYRRVWIFFMICWLFLGCQQVRRGNSVWDKSILCATKQFFGFLFLCVWPALTEGV